MSKSGVRSVIRRSALTNDTLMLARSSLNGDLRFNFLLLVISTGLFHRVKNCEPVSIFHCIYGVGKPVEIENSSSKETD